MNIPATPEMEAQDPNAALGFQSYELFAGDATRAAAVQSFIAGESLQLGIDNTYVMQTEAGKASLASYARDLAALSEQNTNQDVGTPEFRLAEVNFVRQLADINHSGQPEQGTIDHAQALNYELYGKTDEGLAAAMIGRVWQKMEEMKEHPSVQSMAEELRSGFAFRTQDGQELAIPPIPEAEAQEVELPVLEEAVFEDLKARLQQQMQPARATFEQHKESVLDAEGRGAFTPADIVRAFTDAARAMGLEINIILDEHGTALSWSSERNAVVVGGQREAVDKIDTLVGLFTHEAFIHGGRHHNGADEYLKNGLFMLAEEGENPDYLTFEEGLASVCQQAVAGKQEKWDITSVGLYLSVHLAERGYDARQVFEVMKRVRLLFQVKGLEQDIQEEQRQKVINVAANQVVRVFRGTPASRGLRASDGSVLHYGKDKAYAAGKASVIRLLNETAGMTAQEKDEFWTYLLSGKFDPNNARQRQYLSHK